MLYPILLFLFAQAQSARKTSDYLKVYWNFPSEKCMTKHNVPIRTENFGIIENNDHKFIGEKITIFYEYDHGLWPYFKERDISNPINGGLPQIGVLKLKEHLALIKTSIEKSFPDPNFDGPAIFDVEEWRPAYNLNWLSKSHYQTESVKLAKQKQPSLTEEEAEAAGISQFNEAAKTIMLETLKLAKQLRPRAKWGYYKFPLCDFTAVIKGNGLCEEKYRTFNDELHWLYAEQTGIYPSPYLGESALEKTPEEVMTYVHAVLTETTRIQANLPSKIPIYAYTKVEYDPYKANKPFYSQLDICNTFRQYADFGVEGVLIWSTDTLIGQRCGNIAANLEKTIGPYIDAVRDRAEFCAESQCSGNGKCIRMTKPTTCDLEYDFSNYKCECDDGWNGARCDVNRSG